MKIKKIYILLILLLVIINLPSIKKTTLKIENKIKLDSNAELKVLEKYDYISGHSCNKVTVVSEKGKLIGRYDLEDYVAGVVSGETHVLNDKTTFEAMSVAIRTYTLYVTNNCKYSIINSEANQVMDNPSIVSNKIRDAVKKTKGQILTLDGKLVKAEYDSFYMGGTFYCDYKFCYSTYNKVGNKNTKSTKHKIKVPSSWKNDLSGGHGNGMSQYGAKYLASIGYNYTKILKYFYADGVKISTIIKPNLDGLYMDSDGFITRKTRPLRNNLFYYVNDMVPKNALEGESSWYATSRANEILKSENNSNRISYFQDANDYCKIANFEKFFDYNNPKKGAIISWGKHVAIIENVNNNTVDISEAYIGLGYYGIEFSNENLTLKGKFYNKNTNANDRKYNCEKNQSGCFKRTNNVEISSLKNRWGYDFKCYVYLKN